MPRTGWTPDELKQKALDAAEIVIRKAGFERSKLTDVARDLGVSHAALYKHFASKDELLDGVTGRWLTRIDAELAAVAQADGSVIERLQAFFLTLHQLKRQKVMADPELYAAFNASAATRQPSVAAHLAHMKAQLEALIAEGLARGELAPGDPAGISAILFIGTMAFHHPRLVLETITEDRVPALEAVLKALLTGLSAAAGKNAS
ncbi:MAG: TetR family transcriptional regulator [Candidatus Sericytochromatia bacterium]